MVPALCLWAAGCLFFSGFAVESPIQEGNPIVAIQKKLVERISYYFNEVTTDCRQSVPSEAQMTMGEVKSLLSCTLERYRLAHSAWFTINQELIDSVVNLSVGSVEQFVPQESTTVQQRKDQAQFLASAYQRVTGWYKIMGQTTSALAACGMFKQERAANLLNRFNDSLRQITNTGKEAMSNLSAEREMTPADVKQVLNNALKQMFEPARSDMALWDDNLHQARIEFERNLDRETRQLSDVGEQMSNYADIAKRNMAIIEGSFTALQNEAWTIWADLRPDAAKKQSPSAP